MVRPGVIAIDGTKMASNASRGDNRTAEQLAQDILEKAAAADAAEDERTATPAARKCPRTWHPSRRAKLRALLDELEAEAAEKSYEAHLERRAAQEKAMGRPVRDGPQAGVG